jgi:hypothetical protein
MGFYTGFSSKAGYFKTDWLMECLEVKLFNNAIEKYATTLEAIWKGHIFGV